MMCPPRYSKRFEKMTRNVSRPRCRERMRNRGIAIGGCCLTISCTSSTLCAGRSVSLTAWASPTFLAPDQRLTLALPSPYLRNMPTELTIEGGEPGGTHSWSRTEIVSYDEAFKRELVEFHAAICEQRPARTHGMDGLHDVALCHAVARVHMTGEPVLAPSELAAPVRI